MSIQVRATALVFLAVPAGMFVGVPGSQAQAPMDGAMILLDVPAETQVFINDYQTQSTGAHRSYVSRGLEMGKTYPYRIRVVGQFLGKPWVQEETLILRAGETKHLTFTYSGKPILPPRPSESGVPSPGEKSVLSRPRPGVSAPQAELVPLPPPGAVPSKAAFAAIPLAELQLAGGELPPEYAQAAPAPGPFFAALDPRARLGGAGEAYIDMAAPGGPALVLYVPQAGPISGKLILPAPSLQQAVRLTFMTQVDSATDSDKVREQFFRTKLQHYQRFSQSDCAGHAWFRHQVRQAENQLTKLVTAGEPTPAAPTSTANESHLMAWFAMFTGGRAIAENLALDSHVAGASGDRSTVPLATIAGVNIPPINWRSLAPRETPALDPLATCIPADQHAVFFPSVEKALHLAERASDRETVFLRLVDSRTEHWRIRERYEQQLGIPLVELGAILAAETTGTVAVTGSDPHVVLGTDVAILIETQQPVPLANRLVQQIGDGIARYAMTEPAAWKGSGLTAAGFRSTDRRVNSYVAALPGAVVLTNSTWQLQRLAEVLDGETSLAQLPEFAFFRSRYSLGDAGETALVVISDATIRRWCSPRWRIGHARRLLCASALAEWQATWLEHSPDAADEARADLLASMPSVPEGMTVGPAGVCCRCYGSPEFMTPVSELPLTHVSAAEKRSYETWRDAYQRGWIRFDPIAMRLGVDNTRLDVDVTVMPLRLDTKYQFIRELTQGAKLLATAGDPHDSCLEVAIAINKNSSMVNLARMVVASATSPQQPPIGDPLAWFEGTATMYLDDDPAWKELIAKMKGAEQNPQLAAAILAQLPIGAQLEVTNGLELTKFLVAFKAIVETAAPGMLKWELREHRGQPYTRVSAGEVLKGQQGGMPEDVAREVDAAGIYYTASGDALILALRESVLQRALDRRIARRERSEGTRARADRNWLGDNMALHVGPELFRLATNLMGEEARAMLQARSWSNLPILNEWKQRYPDEDPVAVHERLWNVRLVCPGGGDYVWNDAWQTMESTVYGHPAGPKSGPLLPEVFDQFVAADAGLTFDSGGLRSRFALQLSEPLPSDEP